MKKKYLILIIIGYGIAFGASIYTYGDKLSHPLAEDMGHLLPVSMKSIKSAKGDEELQQIVKKAITANDKLSIAGMQHSQGDKPCILMPL